ncbi:hypothetical protein E24_00003 [Faustovirus]|nr:hypothetical protein PRJ_Fausto_00003 [Faustovirus]AMN82939.1 hypothetical protein E24_00003 [Faustovirus]AMN83926.1 hypothetical protein D5a_00003 [Faustovirus]AMN84911.1 hypothetical protein E23_00003 [Faustovirus]QBR98897.1 hypothetical protein [Faustovirus mariensis]
MSVNIDNINNKDQLTPDQIIVVIDKYVKVGNYKAAGDVVDAAFKEAGIDWSTASSVRLVDYIVRIVGGMATYMLNYVTDKCARDIITVTNNKCLQLNYLENIDGFKNMFYLFDKFMINYSKK